MSHAELREPVDLLPGDGLYLYIPPSVYALNDGTDTVLNTAAGIICKAEIGRLLAELYNLSRKFDTAFASPGPYVADYGLNARVAAALPYERDFRVSVSGKAVDRNDRGQSVDILHV